MIGLPTPDKTYSQLYSLNINIMENSICHKTAEPLQELLHTF